MPHRVSTDAKAASGKAATTDGDHSPSTTSPDGGKAATGGGDSPSMASPTNPSENDDGWKAKLDFEVMPTPERKRGCRAVGCPKIAHSDGFCRAHLNRYMVCTGQCGSWECPCGEKNNADFVSRCSRCRKFTREKGGASTPKEGNKLQADDANDEGLDKSGASLEDREESTNTPMVATAQAESEETGCSKKATGDPSPSKSPAAERPPENEQHGSGGSPTKQKSGERQNCPAQESGSNAMNKMVPDSAQTEVGNAAGGSSPHESPGAKMPPEKPDESGSPAKDPKRKRNKKKRDIVQLFAFDVAQEQYNWERPKRRIKTICPFDPTYRKEKKSGCKIGEGFACPQCGSICAYDSRQCNHCQLECCYEAGVGVVLVQERRINYRDLAKKRPGNPATIPAKKGPASPAKKRATAEKKDDANALKQPVNAKPPTSNSSIASSLSSHSQKSSGKSGHSKTNAVNNDERPVKKKQPIAAREEMAKATGEIDNSVPSRVTFTENAATAALKDGDNSSTSSITPISDVDPQRLGAAAASTKEAQEEDRRLQLEAKERLWALLDKHIAINRNAVAAQNDLRDTTRKLETAIVRRDTDAAAFTKKLSSSSSRIAEIRESVASLVSDRDAIHKKFESKGITRHLSRNVPNHSTKIDDLQYAMEGMKRECDQAHERLFCLLSGADAARLKQQKDELFRETVSSLVKITKQKARIAELESTLTAEQQTVQELRDELERLRSTKANK